MILGTLLSRCPASPVRLDQVLPAYTYRKPRGDPGYLGLINRDRPIPESSGIPTMSVGQPLGGDRGVLPGRDLEHGQPLGQ